MGKVKLIVNADDLGGIQEYTETNFRLMEAGIISSSTFLVNHLYTEETARLLRTEKKHLMPHIGLHWNLIDFKPLTEAMRNSPFVDGDGEMHNFRESLSLWTQWKHRKAVLAELEAQIQAFEELTGAAPSHIDAHGHAHITLPGLWALWRSKKAHKIGKVRIARQYPLLPVRSPKDLLKRGTFVLINWLLRRRYRTTGRFIDLRFLSGEFIDPDYVQRVLDKYGTLEVMCHPVLWQNHSERVFLEKEQPFSKWVGAGLVSYADL